MKEKKFAFSLIPEKNSVYKKSFSERKSCKTKEKRIFLQEMVSQFKMPSPGCVFGFD